MTMLDQTLIQLALAEDIGAEDITAHLIDEAAFADATLIVREPAVICGQPWVEAVLQQVDTKLSIHWQTGEGEQAIADQVIARIHGPARSILTAERTAINFLQTLSGTATMTRQYVDQLAGTKTKLLDTRKTIPGWRLAQKYAVRCGGGENHRFGLYDAYLIKENHIAAAGSISKAVALARQLHPEKKLMLEVENLGQLQEALAVKVPHIMLDNFSLADMHAGVVINHAQAKLEVSGNVGLDNIREIALTGVDFISVGAITKHLHAIDFSLRLQI